MKIAIFTETYEPYVSGVTTSIKMLKEALEKMHHKVYIVTVNLKNYHFYYDKKNRIIYIPGIKTKIYDARLSGIYSRKAFKIIKTWNLDIIHSQTEFGIGMFSRIVSKKLHIPVIHTYHTLYEDYVYYVTHNHFNSLGKKVVKKLTKYFCEKKCDGLIVPTEKIKELFIKKYHIRKEINVIPTGIDIEKFKLTPKIEKEMEHIKKEWNLKNDDFIIGAVGRIATEKSFDQLIKNTQKLIEKNKKIKLMIVGDGPEIENLKKLSKDLKINKNVFFTGKTKYELMPAYYNLFHVLVSFSTTETQGLTIIEGLAAKKPVLCINDKSFQKMVKNGYNGYLFKDGNEYGKQITELKENHSLYKTLSENALLSVQEYSKESFGKKVLEVYKKALITKD